VVAVLALVSACCSSNRANVGSGSGQIVIRDEQDPGHGRGAYFITAIDYHFHDAHPTVPLSADRILVVDNQGSALHNVTIPGTTYTHDVKPGHSLYIGRIGNLFTKPGRYPFFCRYHVDRGMKGLIVVK
jgi:hypothetical protein